ncbi:HNH endonuclease [Streptomyces solicavernae]|uniref:HNH endonuclease n=1 Tax=Streptomyces solicavernae TaxID=3043614 RepID=UPI0038CFD346
MDLPPTHAMSWTVDHVLPLSLYPHLALEISNMREAHRTCNSSRGQGNGRGNANGKVSRNW